MIQVRALTIAYQLKVLVLIKKNLYVFKLHLKYGHAWTKLAWMYKSGHGSLTTKRKTL
jgi:hypothetical protein